MPPKKDPTIELFEAIEEQANEKVVRALNHGGDPNGVDNEARRYGITPVHVACQGAKTDILRLLVTYGGKVCRVTPNARPKHPASTPPPFPAATRAAPIQKRFQTVAVCAQQPHVFLFRNKWFTRAALRARSSSSNLAYIMTVLLPG